MHVERFGKRLAVELPEEWVDRYRLRDGDEIDGTALETALKMHLQELEQRRSTAIEDIKARAYPLPPDWKFDRDEANAR